MNTHSRNAVRFVLLSLVLLHWSALPWAQGNSFTNTGSLANARYWYTATCLPNGKVLVVGGQNSGAFLSSAELYDPATGAWTTTGSLNAARRLHTAMLLSSGKVLVAGGQNSSGYLSSAELYDPATGTWTTTGSMPSTRAFHTMTLLADELVLVAGGYGSGFPSPAAIYDPNSGSWTTTGSLNTGRRLHIAALLLDGRVLVAGGQGSSGNLSSAELYDPDTGTWSTTGSMTTNRYWGTATLLPEGNVLAAGGLGSGGYLASAELYDSATGTWTATGSMGTGCYSHTAVLLSSGNVLAAGGYNSTSGYLPSAGLYDPEAGTWTAATSMSNGRGHHTATCLLNGNVLMAAGYGTSGGPLAAAEVFIAAAPATPRDLILTPELTPGNLPRMRLDWISGAPSFRVRRWAVATGGTATQLSPNPTTTTFTDRGGTGNGSPPLEFNRTYWWQVRAVNAAGEVSAYTSRADGAATTLPGTPTKPTVAAGSPPQVDLTWTWAAGGGSLPLNNYRVKRSTSPSGPFELVPDGTPTSTSFTDTTVSGNTQYYYVISAVTASGEGPGSPVSDPVLTPPDPPPGRVADLMIAPGNGAPVLNWTTPAGPAPTSYRVYRAVINDPPMFTLLSTVIGSPPPTTFTDLTAAPEIVLHYYVAAVAAGGEGLRSDTNNVLSTYRRLPKLLISEVQPNPAGSPDSPREWVELLATDDIDFAKDHYSVVFTDNDPAHIDGWIGGGGRTYGFNITAGSVARGGVVYVGGSGMPLSANPKVRFINTGTTAGDRFGEPNPTGGVLGNGGADADGVAVFATDIWNLKSGTVPVDAVFFGTGTGAGVYDLGGLNQGRGGYELPLNDLYSGGKLREDSPVVVDPGGGDILRATAGTFDVNQDGFTAIRTWTLNPGFTPGSSSITINFNAAAPTFAGIPERFSGAVGDANSQLTFTVTPSTATGVSATSGNQAVIPNANIVITQTGPPGQYTLSINPIAVGYAIITVNATANSMTSAKRIDYAASAGGTAGMRFHSFASDASAAFPLDSNYMLVADDEDQVIRLYSRNNSGAPLKVFDFTPFLGLLDRTIDGHNLKEIDIESAASIIVNPGGIRRIFWMAALANEDDFDSAPSRNRIFATDVVGTDLNSYNLKFAGSYNFLRDDLIAWDARTDRVLCDGTPLPAGYYGLGASAGDGVNPKAINGFNVEGLAMAPNGTTAYIGFRAPYCPPGNRTKALIVPLFNINAVVTSGAAPILGNPIELDLGGRGIRSIDGNANGMLIVAGPADNSEDFRLFTWSGNCADQSQERAADLTGLPVESIVEIPSGPLTRSSVVQLLTDSGRTEWYGDGLGAKALPDGFTKFRSALVTVGHIIGPKGYDVYDLGTLGGPFSRGYSINNLGQVTGVADTANFTSHPFRTDVDQFGNPTPMVDLLANECDSGVALGISSAGQVVGVSCWGAFRTQPNSLITALDTLLGGTTARDINTPGQVVGSASGGAFRVEPNQGEVNSPNYLGYVRTGPFQDAFAINDSGVVVGRSGNHSGYPDSYHAFRTGPNMTITETGPAADLGTLGGSWSDARDVNNAGYVVGYSAISGNDNEYHAFLTPPGRGILPSDDLGAWSVARAINNNGDVVGLAAFPGVGQLAAVRYAGATSWMDLNEFLPVGSTWNLYEADDINDSGWIIVFGDDINGTERGLLLKPTP